MPLLEHLQRITIVHEAVICGSPTQPLDFPVRILTTHRGASCEHLRYEREKSGRDLICVIIRLQLDALCARRLQQWCV